MTKAYIGLTVFLLVLMAVAQWRDPEVLQPALKEGGLTFVRFLPILLAAFLIINLIQRLVPAETIEAWLSQSKGPKGHLIAWAVGFVTPGGPMIAFPLVGVLYKAGASVALLVTYVSSVLMLNMIRLPLELGFYGFRLTALRYVSCLVLPLAAGLIAELVTAAVGAEKIAP